MPSNIEKDATIDIDVETTEYQNDIKEFIKSTNYITRKNKIDYIRNAIADIQFKKNNYYKNTSLRVNEEDFLISTKRSYKLRKLNDSNYPKDFIYEIKALFDFILELMWFMDYNDAGKLLEYLNPHLTYDVS
jgi:hypothetical protein